MACRTGCTTRDHESFSACLRSAGTRVAYANSANNTQTDSTTVVEGGNLALTKTGSPSPVPGGSVITYTLTASNAGPNAGGAMVITDNLPPSVARALKRKIAP